MARYGVKRKLVKAKAASYSPPGSGYQHDVGDIAGQTSVAKKKQLLGQMRREWYDRNGGKDGGPARGNVPGNPIAPNGHSRPRYPGGGSGMNARRNDLPSLQGRRRKGNRYYRTD